MSWKTKLVVPLGVAGLVIGGFNALEPKSLHEIDQDKTQEQVSQLSDSQEQQGDRFRRSGDELADADHLDRLRPVEPQPAEPHLTRPHLRFRIVP
jgi:hypothetical protein